MHGLVHHRTIGMFRAGFCTLIGGVTLFDLRDLVALYRSPFAVWFPTPLMDDLGVAQPGLGLMVVIGLLTVAAFWSAAIGFLTRSSLVMAGVGFFAFHSVMLGFSKRSPLLDVTSHQTNLVLYVLVALLVTPSIASWSVDRARSGRPEPEGEAVWVAAWPVRLIRFVLGVAYLGAGLSKLRVSLDWPLGETQQALLFEAYVTRDLELSRTLAESDLAGFVLGMGAIVFEIGFVLVAVTMPIRSWRRVPLAMVGIGFHIATTVLMGIWHFLPYWAPIYLIFLTWEDVARWRGAEVPPEPDPTPTPDPRARAAILGVVALLLVPVAAKAEYWPVSDWGAYSFVTQIGWVEADRLELVGADGSTRWLEPGDLGAPHGHRESTAPFTRFWIDRAGVGGSASHPDNDPAQVEAVLGEYQALLDDDLRAAYPGLRLVRRSVDWVDDAWVVEDEIVAEVALAG